MPEPSLRDRFALKKLDQASEAIAEGHPERALPLLKAAFASGRVRTRLDAISQASRVGTPDAAAWLNELTALPDFVTRWVAEGGLRRIGGDAVVHAGSDVSWPHFCFRCGCPLVAAEPTALMVDFYGYSEACELQPVGGMLCRECEALRCYNCAGTDKPGRCQVCGRPTEVALEGTVRVLEGLIRWK
jgi:hypothetical protein